MKESLSNLANLHKYLTPSKNYLLHLQNEQIIIKYRFSVFEYFRIFGK